MIDCLPSPAELKERESPAHTEREERIPHSSLNLPASTKGIAAVNAPSDRPLLCQLGFQSFLWTQFLGALNDNLYKYIVAFQAAAAIGHPANMSLTGAIFILPFLLFSGYAGWAADAFSKRSVLIATKSMEIAAMALALWAFWLGNVFLGLFVLFLMSLQSTLFSPAKYGILPEMLPEKHLSSANGWLEMSTFLAIILGSALSGTLYKWWGSDLPTIGTILLALAILGTAASFGIGRVPPSGAKVKMRINPWTEIGLGIRRLYGIKPLWRTVIGISYFWFLGSYVQMLLYTIAIDDLGIGEEGMGFLLMYLSIGIGVGSLLAGRLSGDRVELGLIPFGSIGMGVAAIWLATTMNTYYPVAILLVAIGFWGGFFIVPLNAYLQKTTGEEEKGRLIAANNFINMFGVLAAAGLNWLLPVAFHFSTAQTLLVLGILTLGVTVYIARLLPYAVVRIVLKVLTHTLFKITVVGKEHLPSSGPVLLISNHMSFADGCLIGASVPRYMRFLVFKAFFEKRGIRWLLRWLDAIPVSSDSRRDIVEMLRQARESLRAGDAVCLFAEGSISRTGNLLPFHRGFEKIVEGIDAPIIPVYLDGLGGSFFSFDGGRFFWKWPKRLRYPVTVRFGEPLPSGISAIEMRQRILELGSDAAIARKTRLDTLPARFIHQARRSWFSFCMADSTGVSLSYGRALAAGWALSRWINRCTSGQGAIGLMLPASVGGALANLGVVLARKTAVNLNFTTGREALQAAIRQCGIETIITSETLLRRLNLDPLPGMVFLEDILRGIPRVCLLALWLAGFLLPGFLLRRLVSPANCKPDDLAAILFSSGSTGEPKGVMLSHYNIAANLDAITQVLGTWDNNRVCGILPFFHSFGLTGTLWMPLLKGFGVFYHPNPMEARRIGELCQEFRPGILLTTPTFCKGFIRKCDPDSFSSVHHAVTGAERLPEAVSREFRERFGVDLMEGYGCTELSPVVAVNTHDYVAESIHQVGHKPGTIGHPLPGVAVRVVDPDTGEILPPNTSGLLLVRGPNQMTGYWQKPELTESVLRDGWYVTGDIARIDEDGFITITDRLSRFSKIGGEMVPHIKIEEAIEGILLDGSCAVASVPDDIKGERLAVLIAHSSMSPAEIRKRLQETGLPPLWIPKVDDIFAVDEIPALGTGKRDLAGIQRRLRELARNILPAAESHL